MKTKDENGVRLYPIVHVSLPQQILHEVCYGADAAIETIEKYMKLKGEGAK